MKNVLAIFALCVAGVCVAAAADTNAAPRFYMVASSALESHHGEHAASSDYAYLLHTGIDYGSFAIEGVMEGPLAKEQPHVRRALALDVLIHPYAFASVEPFVAVGAGYYFPAAGRDSFATWAVDIGAGVRLPVSEYVFLQEGVRGMVPFEMGVSAFRLQDRFEIMEIGIGGRY